MPSAGRRALSGKAEVAALLRSRLQGTPYLAGALELLDRALDEAERETFLLEERQGNRLAGAAIYGWVAGAMATGRLHLVVPAAEAPDATEIGTALCRAVAERLGGRGARLLVAELPDDPALAWMLDVVRSAGWSEEGRVPDFYRPGIALLLLRLENTR